MGVHRFEPRLQSRFETTIEFADFGPEELTCRKSSLTATHARNVFEAILERMAQRLSDPNLTREELTTVLLREDVPNADQFTKRRAPPDDEDQQSREIARRKTKPRGKRCSGSATALDGRSARKTPDSRY